MLDICGGVTDLRGSSLKRATRKCRQRDKQQNRATTTGMGLKTNIQWMNSKR